MSNGQIKYSVELDTSKLKISAEEAKRIIEQMGGRMVEEGKKVDSIFDGFTSEIGSMKAQMLGFLTIGGATMLAKKIFKVRSEFQQLESSFTTMLQSKAKADQLMSELTTLAATTPFGLQEVAEGAKRLLAFQIPAQEVNKTLRQMGDVAAGLGVPMGQLIHIYGQVKAQGKLMTNDLYQFMNAGIPIIAELSKVMKISEQDVKELVSQGKVGFTEIQQVFQNLTQQGGLFHNMMEGQSKTLAGQFSNLQDNISQMFNEMGEASEGVFSSTISGANFLVEHYQEIGKVLSVLVAIYGTYKTALMANAAIQQVVTRFGQFDIVTKQLQTRATIQAMFAQIKLNMAVLANPYVLLGAAIAGVVVAIWQFSDSTTAAEKAQKRFNEEQKRQNDLISEEKKNIEDLLSVVQDESKAKGQRLIAFEKLQTQYPDIFAKYKTEEELLKNIAQAQKEVNGAMQGRKMEENKAYIERLKEERKKLQFQAKNGNTIANRDYAKAQLEIKEDELKKAQSKYNFDLREQMVQNMAELSASDQKKQYDLLIEEYNRRHNQKELSKAGTSEKKDLRKTTLVPIQNTGFEELTDGDLGYLMAQSRKFAEIEQEKNKTIDNRIALQKEVLNLEKQIQAIQSKTEQSQADKDLLKKLKDEKQAKEKALKEDYGVKNEKTSSKKEKSFDQEAFTRETQRKAFDNEILAQRQQIEQMAEGFAKEKAQIELHYKEKAEAIRRGSEDALLALDKEKKDSQGKMTAETFEARKGEILKNEDISHQINLQTKTQQEQKLLENLLGQYEDYEAQKNKISQKYAQERQILEEQISQASTSQEKEKYQKALTQLQKQFAEELLKLEISSQEASSAIAQLFGDMSQKSVQDLIALQQAGEKAFEALKQGGNLSAESLKAIEDKLKSNKELIRSLSPLFKQIATDFKTLSSKNASLEDKEKAFNGIFDNIQKSNQALSAFGDALKSLGSDSLSQIANMLSDITQRSQGVASALKSVGVGGMASMGIGVGVGILTSVFSQISQAKEQERQREAEFQRKQIQHEKQLRDLQHQRLLEMKQFSNVFVSNKIGRHIEQLNYYKNKQKELATQAQQIQNGRVFSHYEKKGKWFSGGLSIYKTETTAIYKSFKEQYGQLIDEMGNLNLKLIDELNPDSKDFANVLTFSIGKKPELIKGNKDLIESLKKLKAQAEETKAKLEEYVQESFGALGSGFTDSIISAVEKGTNAFDTFGDTVSQVMKNLLKQVLVTDQIKAKFDNFNQEMTKIYAQNMGADPTQVFAQVKEHTLKFVNGVLKPEIEKGEALTKALFDELEKEGIKMYDENAVSRQAKEKGFARMSQDSADELDARFTLMTELQRISNEELKKITLLVQNMKDNADYMQDFSSKSLQHLINIENNTFTLYQIAKEMTQLKNIFNDIQLHGIKIK